MSEPRTLTRDRPLGHWFGAFLFITVSGMFLYLAWSERYSLEPWQVAATVAVGMLGLSAGVWLASEAPRTTVRLDPTREELEVVRAGIFGRTVERYPVASLKRLTLLHRKDDEGYPMTRPGLQLHDGNTVLLSLLWRHGETEATRAIDAVRSALPRLQPPTSPRADVDARS